MAELEFTTVKLQELPDNILFTLACATSHTYRILGVARGNFVCSAVDGPYQGSEVYLPGGIDVIPLEFLQ